MPKQLQKKIEYCLEKHPETRNSDIKLTNAIWYEFYNGKLFRTEKGELAVRLVDLYDLPTEDNVKRIRAKIQNHPNNPRFLPTSAKVRKQRKILEETWRKYLGYNPELREI